MKTDLEIYRESDLDTRYRYAKSLSTASDLVPKGLLEPVVRADFEGGPMYRHADAGKIMLVTEYGSALGIPPIIALQGIHIIEGRISMAATMMSGLITLAGHKIRTVTAGSIETGDYRVTMTLTRSDDVDNPTSVTWTPQRAVRAELLSSYREIDGVWKPIGKDNWAKYTEAMCAARCTSELARLAAPDVFLGSPVYYEGELEESIQRDDGSYIATKVEPSRDVPAAAPAPDVDQWVAKIRATTTLTEYRQVKQDVVSAGLGESLNTVLAEQVGTIQQATSAARAAAAEPTPEPVHEAEVVDEEPAPESDEEAYPDVI